MKKVIILTLSLIFLQGCVQTPKDLSVKTEEVASYNLMVENTVKAYAKVKEYAETHKNEVIEYVIHGGRLPIKAGNSLEDLKEGILRDFEMYTVVYDEYFTSLGADGLREVILLYGETKKMYITLLWGTEEVYSISRVVEDR